MPLDGTRALAEIVLRARQDSLQAERTFSKVA